MIDFVWKMRALFAQGSGWPTRPCLSPKLVGLWGAGKDHALKPSKFVIACDAVTNRPVVTAYLSSVAGAAVFGKFESVEVFKYAPNLALLESHDLAMGWHEQHLALVEALDAGDCREAGYTFSQREEIRQMELVFPPAPKDPFGPQTSTKFVALLELGFAPAKGARVVGARGQAKRVNKDKAEADSEESDWNSEGNEGMEGEGDGGAMEAGELDEDLDQESDESSVNEGPQFVIEDWLDRRWNNMEQCNEYSILFEGYPEPEWTLERRIAGGVPRVIDERFDRRSNAEKAKAKSARQAAAFRAINAGLVDGEEEEEVVAAPAGGEPPAKAPRRSRRMKNKGK